MFTASATIKINADTKTATVVDNTAYEPTISFSDVTVLDTFTVVGPDGTAIIVGGTIDISGGDTESASFNLPLDNAGNILTGTYTLTLVPTFTVTNFAVDSFNSGPTDNIVIAGVDWTDIFDEVGASNSVTTSGATAPADNGTFPVTGVSYAFGDTTLEVNASLVTEDPTSGTISFTVTYVSFVNSVFTFTECDIVVPTAATPYYCNTTQFGQIVFQDTTVLPATQTLVTRLWNISYPGNLVDPVTPPDVTSALPSVTINTLATGTWTWRLTYDVSVTQADGLIYTYTSSSIATEIDVECLTNICELRCGIQKLHEQYALAVNGGAQINALSIPVSLVNSYVIDANNALNCGDQDKFEQYAALILQQLNLAGVDCDCGCSGDSTTEGNHWINNAGFESQTEIAILIGDVATLQSEMAVVQSDIADLQADYQIYAALAATNQVGSLAQTPPIPAQFFGTFGSISGYIRVKFTVYDPFGATITLRDVTTGVDAFSYVLPSATVASFDLVLQNDGTNDFNLTGTRITSGTPPVVTAVTQANIPSTTIVANAVNILKLNSSSASTAWISAEITGIKMP